jgi:hypothetical protein
MCILRQNHSFVKRKPPAGPVDEKAFTKEKKPLQVE